MLRFYFLLSVNVSAATEELHLNKVLQPQEFSANLFLTKLEHNLVVLAVIAIIANNILLTMATAEIWQRSDITNGQVSQMSLEEKSKSADEPICKAVVIIHHSLPTDLLVQLWPCVLVVLYNERLL